MNVVLIPFCGIDVPVSSEGIRLSSEVSRVEVNNKVKLGEELQSVNLLPSQEFGGCKVLQVLVVSDDINQSCRAFKIVVPGPKIIMNSKELLVMGVIVELWSKQSTKIVSDRPNLLIRRMNGENVSDDIVRGICLHNNQSIQNPVGEDRSRDEGVF